MKLFKKTLFVLGVSVFTFVFLFIINFVRINIRYYLEKKNHEETFDVYGNKDGLVPQGLSYSEKYNVVFQTSYSHDVSKLFVIDFDTGELLKDLELFNLDGSKNTKHVGGITTYNNIIWISNDYELDIFDLEKIMNTEEKSIQPVQEIPLSYRGDFCTFYDNVLWIGDFYLYPFYDVPDGDPKVRGYHYQEEIDFEHPDYEVSVPIAVQGMSILPNGEVAFTESYTYLVNSYLTFYQNILTEKDGKFEKKNLLRTKKLPPMAEGFFYKDGELYILFESSSDKYSMADPKVDKVLKYKIEKD